MPSTDSGAGTVPIRNGAFVSCLNYNLPRVGPVPTNSSLADNFDLKEQILALETPNAYLQIVEVNGCETTGDAIKMYLDYTLASISRANGTVLKNTTMVVFGSKPNTTTIGTCKTMSVNLTAGEFIDTVVVANSST